MVQENLIKMLGDAAATSGTVVPMPVASSARLSSQQTLPEHGAKPPLLLARLTRSSDADTDTDAEATSVVVVVIGTSDIDIHRVARLHW
jgi:hypothetical protein